MKHTIPIRCGIGDSATLFGEVISEFVKFPSDNAVPGAEIRNLFPVNITCRGRCRGHNYRKIICMCLAKAMCTVIALLYKMLIEHM